MSYKWDKNKFYPLTDDQQLISLNEHRVFLFGREIAKGEGETAQTVLQAISNDSLRQYSIRAPSAVSMPPGLALNTIHPQILVIDSFNALGKDRAPKDLAKVLRQCATRFMVTIAIIDTGPGISPEHRWVPSEYMADMEIDFSYDRPENYMIRRLWIVKARFQDHADGWHRMKINPRPEEGGVPNPLNPVIKQGGIFVFPSVHRHLSIARGEMDKAKAENKSTARNSNPIPTPFGALTDAIQGGGFPPGCCTCIVGDRGSMKSHLAYYTLLKYIHDCEDRRAIIISLRDSEDAAIDTLADILLQQVGDDGQRLVPKVKGKKQAADYIRKELIGKDRLEILYFWPGYISPEEFFHLVSISVDRPGVTGAESKKETEELSDEEWEKMCKLEPVSLLVINGLEQLSARFPLCAKESMFISGLLAMLTVKGVTVLITSGGGAGLPSDQGGVPAGLLPMSDLIMQASFRRLPTENVWSSAVWFPTDETRYVNPTANTVSKRERMAKGEEPHVIYEIVREPDARECRRRVLFYMGREGDLEGKTSGGIRTGFARGSVYVRPLPDEFPHGLRSET